MDKEIKISYNLKIKSVAEKSRICVGCALNIGFMTCMNVSLCPSTDDKPANWEISGKIEKVEDNG